MTKQEAKDLISAQARHTTSGSAEADNWNRAVFALQENLFYRSFNLNRTQADISDGTKQGVHVEKR